jgi:hypothetical protein
MKYTLPEEEEQIFRGRGRFEEEQRRAESEQPGAFKFQIWNRIGQLTRTEELKESELTVGPAGGN